MASTHSTDSDRSEAGPYRFSFSWEGPYGHSIRLLEHLNPNPGVVLDLGCGYSAIAEPVVERGFQYIGADLDSEALSTVAGRGHETHELDLRATDELAERVVEIIGERHLAAVFALDVLEHLTEPRVLLRALHTALDRLGRPPLIVSVPNVAHVDLAAKLTFGRWDDTTTGLLDRTHLTYFTAARLNWDTRASGFLELGANDFQLDASDQRFPADHPALVTGSPVSEMIRIWRDTADAFGSTVQFVRAFIPADLQPAPTASDRPTSVLGAFVRPLTVVMRTQGRRPSGLADALTCLAAQTVDTFDVLLMVHSDDDGAVERVRSLVAEFDHTFASRVSIIRVPTGGGRSRPLNVALEHVESAYVAFLDDDDLITANWVEAFCSCADDSSIVRSQSAARYVELAADPERVPYVPRSGLEFRFAGDFDLAQHLWGNQTPICSYAVPRTLIEAFGLRFDEQFVVLEDWEFLLRCASLARVRDTGSLTSIVHMWLDGSESSRSVHSAKIWKALEQLNQDRLNAGPLLLPPGAVAQLVDLHDRHCRLQADHQQVARVASESDTLRRERDQLWGELEGLRQRYELVVGSLRWRVLGPPHRAVAMARRWRGRLRRSAAARDRRADR
jgi:SAM-dependent methyltransferase